MNRKIISTLPLWFTLFSFLVSTSAHGGTMFVGDQFVPTSENYLGATPGFATSGEAIDLFNGLVTYNSSLMGGDITSGTPSDNPIFPNGPSWKLSETSRDDIVTDENGGLPDTVKDVFTQIQLDINGAPNSSSQIKLTNKAFGHVDNAASNIFNGFTSSKSNLPFMVNGDSTVPVTVDLSLDATGFISGGGFLSSGMGLKLLNITDPENPQVLDEVAGFYFENSNGIFQEFGQGQVDLGSSFSGIQGSGTLEDPSKFGFDFSMEFEADPSMTYAALFTSDLGVDATGNGIAYLDNSNSTQVTISSLDPNATFSIVPEPNSCTLFVLALLPLIAAIRARR